VWLAQPLQGQRLGARTAGYWQVAAVMAVAATAMEVLTGAATGTTNRASASTAIAVVLVSQAVSQKWRMSFVAKSALVMASV
jgi:hypothetical protein